MRNGYQSFITALINALKEHGKKTQLANDVGVTPKYIGDLVSGRRKASHDLQEKIAAALGLSYRQMLQQGSMLGNSEVMTGKIDKKDMENENIDSDDELLRSTRRILKSKNYSRALAHNIVAFGRAVEQEEELEVMRDNMQEINGRMARMEELLQTLAGQQDEKKANHG